MARDRDEAPAVRVYTVCDESRYLIVRNVPALGCGEGLSNLFASYGDLQECKPMDGEDCEPFTDVYWIKFSLVSNARFAKRKLDEHVFLGNRLQVSYAPDFESLSDAKEKLEVRQKEVISRIKSRRHEEVPRDRLSGHRHEGDSKRHVSSGNDYFSSPSMNETVRLVREKLDNVQSASDHSGAGPASRKSRFDKRRRI